MSHDQKPARVRIVASSTDARRRSDCSAAEAATGRTATGVSAVAEVQASVPNGMSALVLTSLYVFASIVGAIVATLRLLP